MSFSQLIKLITLDWGFWSYGKIVFQHAQNLTKGPGRLKLQLENTIKLTFCRFCQNVPDIRTTIDIYSFTLILNKQMRPNKHGSNVNVMHHLCIYVYEYIYNRSTTTWDWQREWIWNLWLLPVASARIHWPWIKTVGVSFQPKTSPKGFPTSPERN